MAPRVNLLAGATRAGVRRGGDTRRRIYLGLLIFSALLGAGAVAELLARPKAEDPE